MNSFGAFIPTVAVIALAAAVATLAHGTAFASGLGRRRVAVAAVVIVVGLVGTNSASSNPRVSSKIPGCAPQCLPQGLTIPGSLPPGTYKTKYFFAGEMRLSFAKAWYSGEDSTGEFAAWPKANPDSKVIFWEDVYAVAPAKPIGSWRRVGPLRRTSASLLTWLEKNPNLAVSRPVTGKIGKIRARVVDVGVSDRAVNDDPGCPAKACANFVQFPQWNEPYGIAGKSISRFYLSDVRYGRQRHLFVAVIEATSRAELNAFLAPARKLIATVRVPASQG